LAALANTDTTKKVKEEDERANYWLTGENQQS